MKVDRTMTEKTAVGWHESPKGYRYWDGDTWSFAASGRDLARYRRAQTPLPGADVNAPVHGREPRPGITLNSRVVFAVGVLVVAVLGAWINVYLGVALAVLGAIIFFLAWPTETMRKDAQLSAADKAHQDHGLIAGDGPPRCPKCDGTQFKLRRTGGQRAAIGTATVLFGLIGAGAGTVATNQRVQCVTCGLFYGKVS